MTNHDAAAAPVEHSTEALLDALPSMVFVVDEDVRIHKVNSAAATLMMMPREVGILRRAGDTVHCVNSLSTPGGCGHSLECGQCVIRNSVGAAFHHQRVLRRPARLELQRDGRTEEVFALVSATRVDDVDPTRVVLVIEDISELTRLHRMIPICSVCKMVRVEEESWVRVERYLKENWNLSFSHGLCPQCHEQELAHLVQDAADSAMAAPAAPAAPGPDAACQP